MQTRSWHYSRAKTAEPGTTLVELLIAISVNTILIGTIFGVGIAIIRQTKATNRISDCNADICGVLDKLDRDCRGARNLVSWTPQSITIVSGKLGDTLTYSYANGLLNRNKEPIRLVWSQAKVSTFRVHGPPSPPDTAEGWLFLCVDLGVDCGGDEQKMELDYLFPAIYEQPDSTMAAKIDTR
jgi:hypothetical protein